MTILAEIVAERQALADEAGLGPRDFICSRCRLVASAHPIPNCPTFLPQERWAAIISKVAVRRAARESAAC